MLLANNKYTIYVYNYFLEAAGGWQIQLPASCY